jgi:hypothetical protein
LHSDHQQSRDESLLQTENLEPGESSSTLEYWQLNVFEARPNKSIACWETILDMACLDTFLF